MESVATLTFSHLVLLGIGGVTGIISWFLKGTMDEIKDHRDLLASMHERFVKKDDFKEFKEELWMKLDDLKQQLKDK